MTAHTSYQLKKSTVLQLAFALIVILSVLVIYNFQNVYSFQNMANDIEQNLSNDESVRPVLMTYRHRNDAIEMKITLNDTTRSLSKYLSEAKQFVCQHPVLMESLIAGETVELVLVATRTKSDKYVDAVISLDDCPK